MATYLQSIIRLVLIFCVNSLIHGQDLLSVKPEVFIEGQPGEVTCTYNNKFTTFTITGPISTIAITRCRVQTPTPCKLNPLSTIDHSQYYNISQTNNSVTVHINSVSRTRDGGQWKCKAFVSSSDQQEDNITIDVKVPVPYINIENKGSLIFIENVTKDVKCKTGPSYPTVTTFNWTVDGKIQPTSSINTEDSTTTSTLRYQPSKLHNNKTLQCTAYNGFGQTKTDSTVLNVQFGVSSVEIENKDSLTFTDGDKTSINCLVGDSNPTATIRWSTENQQQSETSNIYRYTARKSNDGKTLTCTASNGIGEAKSDSIILNIQYKPVVNLNPQSTSYYIIKGEKLYLQCIVDSNPKVQPGGFTWKKNNQILSGKTSPILIITETGNYTCTARNNIGEATTNTTDVQVSYGPIITVSEKSLQIKEGTTIELTCSVDSNPPPTTIQWYYIRDGTRQLATRPLSISSRNQSGIYWCNATTTLISSNTSRSNYTQTNGKQVTVEVYYLDPVKLLMDIQTINEADELNITCSTKSNPKSSVTWLNGSDVIETINNTNKASLVREKADCLYTGNYSCKFANSQFPIQTETTPVYVTCSPRLDSRKEVSTKISGNIGETIKLEVQVISYPKPTFQWYYLDNNTPSLIVNNSLFQEEIIQVDTMIFKSLLVFKIQDTTFYRDYKLQTEYDNNLIDIVTTSLLSQAVPDKVTSFKVTNISEDSICVEWKPGFNGGAVQDFIVEYSTDNLTWINSSPDTKLYDASSTMYCIRNLHSNTVYYIRIFSRNRFGSTDYIYIDDESDLIRTSALQTEPGSGVQPVDYTPIIGGVVGCVVLLLIIGIIVVILRRRRPPKAINETNGSESTMALNSVPAGENRMIIDMVVDYVSADDITHDEKTVTDGATYAAVDKSKNIEKDRLKSEDPSTLYSTVDKEKNRSKTEKIKSEENEKKTKAEKKNLQKTKPCTKPKPDKKHTTSAAKSPPPKHVHGDAYENVGIFGPASVYENSSNCLKEEPKKEYDDLVYVDLKFDKKPSNKVIKKQTEEDKVEYGSIDYGKRGPTPPPSSDSSDNEMDYLPPKKE